MKRFIKIGYQKIIRSFWPRSLKKFHEQFSFQGLEKNTPENHPLWLHAASSGELETLFPVLKWWLEDKKKCALLTVFSPSGYEKVKKWQSSFHSKKLLYAGPCPQEGFWEDAFEAWKPLGFLTVKYELWPELLWALSKKKISLGMLSARWRSSLKWIRPWSALIQGPSFHFFCETKEEGIRLKKQFPKSDFSHLPSLRWLQIQKRAQNASAALPKKWKHILSQTSSPKWVLGSVWEEDLIRFEPVWSQFNGTLVVVPHVVKAQWIEKWKKKMSERLHTYWVEEQGYLLELYRFADGAYIGGGFGQGAHSVLEPAFFGIPVSVGPRGVLKEMERKCLLALGQVKIVRGVKEMNQWQQAFLKNKTFGEQKKHWQHAHQKWIDEANQFSHKIESWLLKRGRSHYGV